MSTSTINLSEKTVKHFSVNNLEKFINSEDFEDFVLGYQMIKGESGKTESFSNFKKSLGI